MKHHFKEQIKLVSLVERYFINCKKAGIDISLSPKCFMTTWALTPGYFTLKFLTNSWNFSFFKFFMKDLFSSSYHHDLFCHKYIKEKKIDNLIISYCRKNNFQKDGSYFDDYFKTSSKNTNSFWFLISLDNFEPLKLKSNNEFRNAVFKKSREVYKQNFEYEKIYGSIVNDLIKLSE